MTDRCVGGTPLEPPPPSQHRPMRRALVLIALLCLLAPASSVASTASEGKRVIQDCASDGEVNGHYSQAAYKYALHHIPSDLAEYTNCTDAIRSAQAAAAGHHASGSGGGGGFTGGGTGAVGGGLGAPATPAAGGLSPSERSTIQGARCDSLPPECSNPVSTSIASPFRTGVTLIPRICWSIHLHRRLAGQLMLRGGLGRLSLCCRP